MTFRYNVDHTTHYTFVCCIVVCSTFEIQKYITISQGAAGFPGARGLPGPPGNNVSNC